MKICNKCLVCKPTTDFYKKSTSKDGLFWWCRECHKVYVKGKYAKAYANPEFQAHEQQRIKQFYAANAEKKKVSDKRYATNNAGKISAKVRKYKYTKICRTPNWLGADELWMMEQAYELAALRTKLFGFAWHVDHVIPLQGKLVSGLHTPYNLQVIPGRDNMSKSNRFTVS